MSVDLSTLNPAQREAVEHRGGPLLVLAGAGSGKTRVVTYRVARIIDDGEPPQSVLAVTFTNKAAREMRERLAQLVGRSIAKGVTVATFHAFGVQVLREHIQRLGYRARFAILDQGDQTALVRRILKDLKADAKRFSPDDILSALSLARNSGEGRAELLRSGGHLRRIAGHVMSRYDEARRALNAVDFDDLLHLPIQLLSQYEDLREAYRSRYRHLIVDEYQDTNFQQLELLRLLSRPDSDICVVGDDDQSIYAWRGARAANILQFERHFAGTKVVALEQNYRSSREILAVANAIIVNNPDRRDKTLRSDRSPGRAVRVWTCKDEVEEAERVAEAIRAGMRHDQRPASAFGLLYRTNAQAEKFEAALSVARIPYQVVGGTRFFDRKEIRDALAYLRLMVDPFDELALLRAINTPPRGIGQATLDRLGHFADEHKIGLWSACLRAAEVPGVEGRQEAAIETFCGLIQSYQARFDGRPDGGALRDLLKEVRFEADIHKQTGSFGDAVRRIENLSQLSEQLDRYRERPETTLSDFLDNVTLDPARPDAEEAPRDAVTLMTLHAAKGLEFDVVFLVGVEEGLLPFRRVGEEGDIEEERRLCYVGVTRARQELTITHARTRRSGFERLPRKPSRFLAEMRDTVRRNPAEDLPEEDPAELQRERAAEMFAELRRRLSERR